MVLALIALAFGLDATRKLAVDAFPDVTNIQVQVATEVPGRSPDEVERMVTVPVEIGMIGIPGMTEMRSQKRAGSLDRDPGIYRRDAAILRPAAGFRAVGGCPQPFA